MSLMQKKKPDRKYSISSIEGRNDELFEWFSNMRDKAQGVRSPRCLVVSQRPGRTADTEAKPSLYSTSNQATANISGVVEQHDASFTSSSSPNLELEAIFK